MGGRGLVRATGRAGCKVLAVAALASCAACGGGAGESAYSVTRTATRASAPVLPGATSEERFSRDEPGARAATPPAAAFAYELPEGWEELAPAPFRDVNLRPGGDPDLECTVSSLGGAAGGLVENVNRWRSQMGLAPAGPTDVDALEEREILGREAAWVDLEGTFTAMGGEPRAGWRLVGAIAPGANDTVFAKLTGPRDAVERELSSFEDFVASLRPGEGGPGATAQAAAGPQPKGEDRLDGAEDEAGGLRWSAPPSWRRVSPGMMRIVDFRIGAETEAWISVLGGDGGGLLANLERWCSQVGAASLAPQEVDALERLEVLGQDCPLFERTGTTAEGERAMLGLPCIRQIEGTSVFVKLIGPPGEVAAAREDFIVFCRSLEVAR